MTEFDVSCFIAEICSMNPNYIITYIKKSDRESLARMLLQCQCSENHFKSVA